MLVAWMLAAPAYGAAPECAAPLLSLDPEGKVVSGSKEAVRNAATRGDALRIGWRITFGKGEHDFVQHWADAAFVTVFEGETFAQISPIHAQSPLFDQAHVVLRDAPQEWRALLGTNGKLVGRLSGDDSPVEETTIEQTWCLAGAAADRCTQPSWRVLYHHDATGKLLAGDKRLLFDAIRRGDPIRLSWGTANADKSLSVEHSADPIFVTIASGREAYAQLPAHARQVEYADPSRSRIEDPRALWRAVIGTDGAFDVAWTSGEGETHKAPQRAAVRWLAFSPDPVCDARRVPELAVAGGVLADK